MCALPEEKASIIARSKQCDVLVFKVKDRPVWGTQPHFEMGIVQSLRYIDKVKGNQVPDKQIFFSDDQYMPQDSGWVIPLMKRFHETQPVDSTNCCWTIEKGGGQWICFRPVSLIFQLFALVSIKFPYSNLIQYRIPNIQSLPNQPLYIGDLQIRGVNLPSALVILLTDKQPLLQPLHNTILG